MAPLWSSVSITFAIRMEVMEEKRDILLSPLSLKEQISLRWRAFYHSILRTVNTEGKRENKPGNPM